MTYVPHPSFNTDGLENTKLWRYIDFSKFVDLLRTKTLFFSNLEHLAEGDSKEGLYTEADKAIWSRPFESLAQTEKDYFQLTDATSWQRLSSAYLTVMNNANISRKDYFVNCWHASQHENYAMWKIYARENSGICVQSNFGRLTQALKVHTDAAIYVGSVRYRNYESELIGLLNTYDTAISKRREFSYEAEVRAVIGQFDRSKGEPKDGLSVLVNLDDLIENVFVSPYADRYVMEAIRDILKKYKISKPVLKSAI